MLIAGSRSLSPLQTILHSLYNWQYYFKDEDTAHRKKKRKFHSIPLVTPNDSSHASITLSNDENIVQVVVKRAQPESRRGAPIEYDNKGHQLLKRLGWRENSGLGRKENGTYPLLYNWSNIISL